MLQWHHGQCVGKPASTIIETISSVLINLGRLRVEYRSAFNWRSPKNVNAASP